MSAPTGESHVYPSLQPNADIQLEVYILYMYTLHIYIVCTLYTYILFASSLFDFPIPSLQQLVSSGPSAPPPDYTHTPSHHLPPSQHHNMQWSVWSVHAAHSPTTLHHHTHYLNQTHTPIPVSRSDPLAVSTLQLHKVYILYILL